MIKTGNVEIEGDITDPKNQVLVHNGFDLTEANLKELVKEDDKGQPVDNHQPEDSAAAFFMLNERKLELLVSTLSLKALRRVTLNVALGGLGKREHKLIGGPQGNEQKTAYALNEAVTQRFMMQLALEMKKVEEADIAEKANNAKLINPEVISEGEQNGSPT